MLISFENNNIDLGILVKNSSSKFEISNVDSNGFTLSNSFLRLKYVTEDLGGTSRLYLDIFTNPVIRIEGGLDLNNYIIDDCYSERLMFLSDDTNKDESYILAETELESPITLEDFNGNINAYNQIKMMEDYSKECRKDIYISPNSDWFDEAKEILWNVTQKSTLINYYNNWSSAYKVKKEVSFTKRLLNLFL